MKGSCWIAMALAGILVSACGAAKDPAPAEPAAAAEPAQGAQLANPASVNCQEKGGRLEIVDTPEGQVGYCTLPDGTRCEEWAYFRGECPPAAE